MSKIHSVIYSLAAVCCHSRSLCTGIEACSYRAVVRISVQLESQLPSVKRLSVYHCIFFCVKKLVLADSSGLHIWQ